MDKLKPQQQLITHRPKSGQWGDCYRTCIAVILGRDAASVPHFCENGERNVDDVDGLIAARAFLKSEGFSISKSVYSGDLTFAAFKKWMAKFNPDCPFIVTGMGSRGVNHCIVMQGGMVICDPINGQADQDALYGPAEADGEAHWWVEVIVPRATPSVEEAAKVILDEIMSVEEHDVWYAAQDAMDRGGIVGASDIVIAALRALAGEAE